MSTLATPASRNATELPGEPRRLHIMHGVLSLELGGLERLVIDLVREGARRQQRMSVICIERRGRLAEQAEAAGAEVFSLHKPVGNKPHTIGQAAELLAQLAPSVVHTHQVGALWYLGNAARRVGGVPVVHTEHSDHVAHARGWLEKLRARLLWRRCAPLATRFCCVSEDIARSVRRYGTVPSVKVDVVENGIDLAGSAPPDCGAAARSELGIPAGAIVLGTVGRLVEVKRQDLLLRALAAMRHRGEHANTWLLLVGDGPQRGPLEALARELHLDDRTVFAGYRPEPQRLLRAMDLFVLTSRHEGLPLALLEAWAAGLPVVASAVGAIPQTVMHGVSGLLFPSGDVQALVETIERLLEAPWMLSQLGRRGRARVENRYSLTRMADEYEERYRRFTTPDVPVS